MMSERSILYLNTTFQNSWLLGLYVDPMQLGSTCKKFLNWKFSPIREFSTLDA
jgi:hypothetical protein